MSELKDLLLRQGQAFETFKRANDARFVQIETMGNSDPVLDQKVNKANEDVGRLLKMIEGLEVRMNRPDASTSDFEMDQGPSVKAMENFMRDGDIAEMKAMSIGIDADGGYAIPSELDSKLKNYLFKANVMRQISLVKNINSAKYSKAVNTGGLDAGWVGGTDARPETITPTIAEVIPPAAELYANPAASQHMIDDADFDLASWFMGEIQGKFASLEGEAYIIGDGINKPKGVLGYPSTTTDDNVRAFGTLKHTVAAAAATISGDELINLSYDLQGIYRLGAVWVMNSKTAALIRTLKDTNGQYLWQPNFQSGQPADLAGYQCFIDESMPDIATGNISVMFGNFKMGYEILDRNTNMLRDPYTKKPFTLFYTTKRVSGMVVDSKAIRLLQQA